MTFHETTLEGLWLIDLEPRRDERGFLARTYGDTAFAERGLNTAWPECNLSYTLRAGTVRGMHYQADPHAETKLIRCSGGAIYDVLVDLRPGSPTFGKWEGFTLKAEDYRQLYVPGGFAHGLQALVDGTEVSYLMSDRYFPNLARGVRHDDQQLAIAWPLPVSVISERDRTLPTLADLA